LKGIKDDDKDVEDNKNFFPWYKWPINKSVKIIKMESYIPDSLFFIIKNLINILFEDFLLKMKKNKLCYQNLKRMAFHLIVI
jgi:hypothetical protein